MQRVELKTPAETGYLSQFQNYGVVRQCKRGCSSGSVEKQVPGCGPSSRETSQSVETFSGSISDVNGDGIGIRNGKCSQKEREHDCSGFSRLVSCVQMGRVKSDEQYIPHYGNHSKNRKNRFFLFFLSFSAKKTETKQGRTTP
jgi:hypothetical protein